MVAQAYALPTGLGTAAQKELINFALSQRPLPLPLSLRGTAPILKPLRVKHNPTPNGWAAPGTRYGVKIAAIAHALASITAGERKVPPRANES